LTLGSKLGIWLGLGVTTKQWHIQKLYVGGTPKHQRREDWSVCAKWGRLWGGCPLSSWQAGSWGRRELLQWHPRRSPVANEFTAYSRPENASCRKKNV